LSENADYRFLSSL